MASRSRSMLVCWAVLSAGMTTPGFADETGCHKQVVKQLLKYEKTLVKVFTGCFDQENLEKIAGPCLDATGQAKLDGVELKIEAKIGSSCTPVDLAALGFSSSCADYGSGTTTVGASCAGLPAGTVAEAVDCLECWKTAELKSYVAALYASHALEACGGAVDSTSPDCQPLACAAPQPEQRNLGSSGADSLCQKGIGKAGFKYMLKRIKVLSGCGLAGGTRAACLADTTVQEKLVLLEAKKAIIIQNKCGNVNPEPVAAFCCRTGAGNACVAASTRADCEFMGFTFQDDKFCDVDSTCQSLGGDKQFAWWGSCPDNPACPGTALATTGDLTGCVDSVADRLVDRLLCLQIPRNLNADWPCPSTSTSSTSTTSRTTTSTIPDGTQPCESATNPYCNGTCGGGGTCGPTNVFPNTACVCAPPGETPCGDATLPVCDGVCPAGQECQGNRTRRHPLHVRLRPPRPVRVSILGDVPRRRDLLHRRTLLRVGAVSRRPLARA